MITAPPILENQLQHERTARALAALQRGEMQVTVLNDCTWMVASKGSRYTVSLDGDAWACTCPDFSRTLPAVWLALQAHRSGPSHRDGQDRRIRAGKPIHVSTVFNQSHGGTNDPIHANT